MSRLHFIIDRIEEKNTMMQLCSFETSVYEQIQGAGEWTPLGRVLMDSDNKHLIYVVDTPNGWEYIRFPLKLWKQMDVLLVRDQDVLLVTSLNEQGKPYKSVVLKDFHKECHYLIENMRENANYGEDMEKIVEEYFAHTLEKIG